MAKHVFYNASVLLNSVDVSDRVESVEFTLGINGQPAAAQGEVQDYEMPGTQTISDITLNMYQDFAASKTYATIKPLWANRATFNAVIKPDAGGVAATNPQFTVPVFIKAFPPISATRGDRHMTQVVLGIGGVLQIAEA